MNVVFVVLSALINEEIHLITGGSNGIDTLSNDNKYVSKHLKYFEYFFLFLPKNEVI